MKIFSAAKLRRSAALISLILVTAGIASAQSAAPGPADNPTKKRAAKGGSSESVRSGTVLAPDGQTAITSIDRKWDPKSGTGTLNEAAVTPDGKVSSREANLTRHPDGTLIAKGTFTDFDGKSFNYTETTKQTPAGQVVTGQLVDENGKVSTYETKSTRASRGETKRTTVITHPDGRTETRVEVLAAAKAAPGV